MTTTQDELTNLCQCGCGTLVKGKYARGHWARTQKANRDITPLPGPDDELPPDDEDLPAELVAELDEMDQLAWLDERTDNARATAERDDEPRDDPPAARIPPSRTTAGAGGKRGKTRVTVTIQRDVQAKIRMVLMPAGKLWQVRDPVCGSVFVEQEPDISEALAEIVCDSPDLLNWFTGPAGGYMKYFKLVMAVQPVALVVWMHHVAHAERRVPVDGQQPQQQTAYAA